MYTSCIIKREWGVDMQVLIVEDEKNLALALAQIMKEQKFQTTIAYDGEDGLSYATSGIFDIMILDVMLPKRNGFELVKEVRAQHIETPILMLTALDEIPDKVRGLNNGADDYMTKPFAPAELLARIHALTRRKGEVVLDELTYGDLVLQLATCELYVKEKHIRLGFKEFEIMKLLMSRPTMILSKEELINQVWGSESEAVDNNVEAYISFLRKKLFYLGSRMSIKAMRRLGYRLEDDTHD